MLKVITIIGEEKTGKTTLFRQIVKKKKPAPMVNYFEEIIDIEGNNYKLIDTPQFFFSARTEIEKAKKDQLIKLLKKSDLVL
jgi:predicted GTPase